MNKKLAINKDKVFTYWLSYYIVLSVINFFIYLVPVISSGYLSFLLIPAPFFIVLLLASFAYKFRNNFTAYLFLIIYLFIFILHMGLSVKGFTNLLLNIFLLVGIIGAFQYFFLIRRIVRNSKHNTNL
ncbi:MAG: hypothetical protein PF572_05705 [Patescibacteria group bacterium]|jgi:hypothetical protein|nr:hypothetical protein [Patescibacteria group bacterium]